MPKRKRSTEDAVQSKLENHRISLFRAISSAKAAERKRFGARLREPGLGAQKKERLQREHDVLKALDLRQVARNHLHSNLVRIKAVEASSHLPAELRAGIPKSTLSADDITIRNNVVSMLCNTGPAKQALDRAVADICETLGVPVAEKSKRARKNRRKDAEEQPSDRMQSVESSEEDDADDEDDAIGAVATAEGSDEESDFRGFSPDSEVAAGPDGIEGSDEEGAVSKFDTLLGGSSDDEEEFDEEILAKYRGREQVNLDDISLSGSASEAEEDADLVSSEEPEPEPESAPKKVKSKITGGDGQVKRATPAAGSKEKEEKGSAKKKKSAKAVEKATKSGTSAFLPTLMGGYISGSESASDIDAPPKKKRRGQRDRQAIWEKKYGANAKHLQKAAASGKGGRDGGWDMRRGAVGPEDRGKGRFKRGSRGPTMRSDRGVNGREVAEKRAEPKPTKKDDQGPLHPSWEAKKKAKSAVMEAAFSGSKIVFD